jgi:hypothetical protein
VTLHPDLIMLFLSPQIVDYKTLTKLNKELIDARAKLKRHYNFRQEAMRKALFVDDLLYSKMVVHE